MPQANPGKEQQGGYSYTVQATVKQVQDFYEREMLQAGWESWATGTGETGGVILLYQKDGKMVTIGAAPQADVILVVIVLS